MATEQTFRRIALALDGVIESAHMGHPDFRAHGRIFVTLQHDRSWGALMLTPEQQQRFMAGEPAAFKPAAGAWGAAGSTLVHLPAVAEDVLGEAITLSWQNAAAKATNKSKTTTNAKRKTNVKRKTRNVKRKTTKKAKR